MAEMGHEDHLPRPSLSDRCRLGEATFAEMGGKEQIAPKTVIVAIRIEPPGSTPKLSFG